MEQSGVGDYAIWREQLKARLLAQGLFSQDKKSVLFPNTHKRLVYLHRQQVLPLLTFSKFYERDIR